MNKYGVENKGPGGVTSRPKLSGPELLCRLKSRVQVMTLTPDLQPFASLSWSSQLPVKPVTSELGPYKQCAVVSSAGSLRNSGLGKEIGKIYLVYIHGLHNELEKISLEICVRLIISLLLQC